VELNRPDDLRPTRMNAQTKLQCHVPQQCIACATESIDESSNGRRLSKSDMAFTASSNN